MKDPVEARADESEDLYDVASWEPRSRLDRLAVKTHQGVLRAGRALLVALGVFIFLLILGGGAAAHLFANPFILALVALSVVPAALLALYIYTTDITTDEPPSLLAATFVLAVLFAGFAAIINTTFKGLFGFGAGGIVAAVGPVPGLQLLVMVLFYYLIVGPGEEAVKLLAVRLHAYRDDRFDSVIDGAVYGAVAGLGFASIENVLYITQNISGPSAVVTQSAAEFAAAFFQTLDAGGEITAVRSLAGPGHVIYSAFAGYYLGLARFNPENAGPIVAKGLLIAAFIHGTYNILVGIVPVVVGAFVSIPVFVIFVGFVVVYDGVFFYALYRKLARYRATYERVSDDVDDPEAADSELTEFDPDTNP
ncbi:PrsW family intramembrane metalloprotease [Natronomonas amylolytica]|uniref:PrsW family intramembrane metalloprotease n=1 Tax=Natronomonas amylolytica TaxID=3108498 RepID=UPI0030085701